jgi:hypothetical protein
MLFLENANVYFSSPFFPSPNLFYVEGKKIKMALGDKYTHF